LEDKEKHERQTSESQKNEQEETKSSQYQGNRRRSFYNRKRRYSSPYYQQKRESLRFNKVSIIIPLLNEAESLTPLSHEIRKVLKPVDVGFEVIFVDDGSSDNSLKIIKEICRTDKRFKYLSFKKNYGKSAALQMGFKNVTGDVVVTMDADLQDDPSEIPNLLKKLDEGFDLVSGWKKNRKDPFIKKYSSRFFNFITRIISRIKIHDFNCGLKAYRQEVIENIYIYGELHRYIPLLAHWQGFTVSEVVVKHHSRRYGKTKFGISRFYKGFIDLITVVFTTRYVKRPMHLFGFLGALAFLAGIIVNGYLTYLWITGGYLSNIPMLFLGILLIIVGVQFFSVGLLGEMFVHNTRSDKEYIIKEKG
jgi:glycosyltransferase involved in cell wall biosynthesis